MRNKPRIRFKGFTEDWEQRKLSEVVTINPKTELPDKFKYVDLESVVGTNLLGFQVIKKENAPSRAQRLASYGDVFYQTVRPYQRNNYLFENIDKDMVFSTGYAQLRSKLDNYFLLTLVQNDNFVKVVLDNCTGTSYPAINGSELGKITVQIPSNDAEANQIGKVFRGIDNIITLHQRKLEKLKLAKKALLQKLFPKNGSQFPEIRFKGFTDAWEQCKLGSLATVEMNKRIFKEQTTTKGDIPFYKIGTFGSDADSFISRDLFEEYKNKYPYPNIGDILISASGSIGRTVVYNGEDAYYQDSNIVWLNHNGKIDNSFLLQFYNQVKWAGLEGSTIKRLYNKNILETYIAVPKIEEQRLIGEFFKLVDSSITLHQRKLDRLQEVKIGLLQKMFV